MQPELVPIVSAPIELDPTTSYITEDELRASARASATARASAGVSVAYPFTPASLTASIQQKYLQSRDSW